MALDHRARGGGVDVAGEHEHGVVGPVIVAEPLVDDLERGAIEIGHRADRRVPVGVAFGEKGFEQA